MHGEQATTWVTDKGGHESETDGAGPSWDEIEAFIRAHL